MKKLITILILSAFVFSALGSIAAAESFPRSWLWDTSALKMVDTSKFKKNPPYIIGFSNASVSNSWRVYFDLQVRAEAEAQKDLIKKPYWVSFVLDMQRTVQNVVRYSPKNLMHYVDLLPSDSMFSTIGIAAAELPATIQSILLGGNVRVGMEDNLFYRKGVLAESNAQLVERIAKLGTELGREPASPQEARRLLGIPEL